MPLNSMKTWVDGALVSASDLNAEVRDPINALTPGHQVLTTTARDALTGVATGTMIYNSTKGYTEVWDGSSWTLPWLTLVSTGTTTQSGTGISTLTTDITWPTGYRYYVIDFQFGPSSASRVNGATWQYLNGSTPYSSALYNYTYVTMGSTYTGTYSVNQTSAQWVGGVSGGTTAILRGEFFLSSPVYYPSFRITAPPQYSSQPNYIITGNYSSATNQPYTGIRFTWTLSSTGTDTLSWRIYAQS